MSNKSILIAAVLVASVATGVQADAANMSLNGIVSNSCTLTLGGDGALAVSANGRNLSSKNAGGSAATVALLTTGQTFKVEVDPATTLALTPTGGAADTVAVTYGSTGVTTLSNVVAGTPSNIDAGLTTVKVDVSADRTATVFPSGTYRADVVVRCTAR